SAMVPLRDATAGNVNLRLEEVDVGALSRSIKGFPIRLEGRAGGKVEGKLTLAAKDKPREFVGHVALEAKRLRVQNIPTERLHGTVTYRGETVEYHLQGSVLGGTFDVQGKLPPRQRMKDEGGRMNGKQP